MCVGSALYVCVCFVFLWLLVHTSKSLSSSLMRMSGMASTVA